MLRFVHFPFALILLAAGGASVQAASFTNSYSQCYISNINGTEQTSTTPGVASSAIQGVCSASALADFGLLKSYSSSGASPYLSNANAQFSIDYYLSDPGLPANTPITLNVPLNYHVFISANPGPFNGAAFSIFLGGNVAPFYSLNLVTSSDPFSNNNCPNPLASSPKCNGEYQGILNLSVDAFINTVLPNRLWISAYGSSTFGGLEDAWNTVSLGATTLPVGVNVSYPDLSGNPGNFQPAATGIPEPATLPLVFAALAAIGMRRRNKR